MSFQGQLLYLKVRARLICDLDGTLCHFKVNLWPRRLLVVSQGQSRLICDLDDAPRHVKVRPRSICDLDDALCHFKVNLWPWRRPTTFQGHSKVILWPWRCLVVPQSVRWYGATCRSVVAAWLVLRTKTMWRVRAGSAAHGEKLSWSTPNPVSSGMGDPVSIKLEMQKIYLGK